MNNVRTNNRFFVLIKEREFFRKPFYCLGVFKQATCVTFNKRYGITTRNYHLYSYQQPDPPTHPPTHPLHSPLHSTPLHSVPLRSWVLVSTMRVAFLLGVAHLQLQTGNLASKIGLCGLVCKLHAPLKICDTRAQTTLGQLIIAALTNWR